MPLSTTSAWKRHNLKADVQETKDDLFLLIVEYQIHINVECKVHAYNLHSCFFVFMLNQKNYGTFRKLIFVRLLFAWIKFHEFQGFFGKCGKVLLFFYPPKLIYANFLSKFFQRSLSLNKKFCRENKSIAISQIWQNFYGQK